MSLRAWATQIKRQVWVWDDTYSVGQIAHLSVLLRDILPLPRPTTRLHGYNFIFNNQTNSNLGDDGYDNYQAPMDGARALFSRRMWVGGALDHYAPIRANDVVRCTERVRAVRQVGASVFVTVARDMARGGDRVMEEKRTLVYTNERYGGGEGNDMERGSDGGSESSEFPKAPRLCVQEKHQAERFLQTEGQTHQTESFLTILPPSASRERPARQTSPKLNLSILDNFGLTSTPLGSAVSVNDGNISTGLLFRLSDVMRFCSLSYNLHKIHYDRRYCASENLPNVVVPGPLLALVMLHYVSSLLPDADIGRFVYRNSLPCYIDEPVELVLRAHNGGYDVRVMRGQQLLAGGQVAVR